MSAEAKKSYGSTLALLMLGLLALYGGHKLASGADSRCRAGVVCGRSRQKKPQLTPGGE